MSVKYKALRKGTRKWVYGYYVIINPVIKHVEKKSFRIYTGRTLDDFAPEWYEVLPETVCEFTGLLDKKGRCIYTGDLLSINGSEEQVYVTRERNGSFECRCPKYEYYRHRLEPNSDSITYEVIGSIYGGN